MPVTINGVEQYVGRVWFVSGPDSTGQVIVKVVTDNGDIISLYHILPGDATRDIAPEWEEKRRQRAALKGEAYVFQEVLIELFKLNVGSIVRFIGGHKAEADDREWEVLRYNTRRSRIGTLITVDVESCGEIILSVAPSSLETIPVPDRKTPAKGRCLQCCTMQPLSEYLYHSRWIEGYDSCTRYCKSCVIAQYCEGASETAKALFRAILNMEACTANRQANRAAWVDEMIECGAYNELTEKFQQRWRL